MTTRPGSRATRSLVYLAFSVSALGACSGAMQTGPADIPALEQTASQSATPEALTQLGVAYYNAERHADARTTLQRALTAGARDGTAALYLGLANEELGDFTAARAAYEQYIATGSSSSMKKQIQGRVVLVSRQELKQQAKVALQREQELATEAPTPQSIAVLPFRLVGISDDMKPLQTALADMIITDLGFTRLRSIERVRVQSMLDEIALAAGGITDEQTGARMGRMLRAERIVQGQITGSGGQDVSIDALVLNTASRTAPAAPVTRQGQLQAIFDLEKQMVFGILAEAQYTLSPTEREQINENRAANLLAFLAYGRGLEATDRGDYGTAAAHFRQATQLDPNFAAARTQSVEAAQMNTASQTTPNEIAVQQSAPVASTTSLASSIAFDLNPSPAQSLAGPSSGGSTQTTTTTASERGSPTTEGSTTPPLSQAKKATVVITIQNPVPRIVLAPVLGGN